MTEKERLPCLNQTILVSETSAVNPFARPTTLPYNPRSTQMPPSTLQARIKAFEALGTGASKEVLDSVAIHPEPDHLLDRPHSPSAASIPPIVPTTYSPSASPSLQHKSSLIDLKDWVIDDGPFRPSYSTTTTILSGYSPLQTIKPLSHESAPLISFEAPPPNFSKAPPLPPRKLSFNSPRSVSAPAASPTTNSMLMPPEPDQPYPPILTDVSTTDGTRRAQGHVAASSVSSFHSVSLSSDGDDYAPVGGIGSLHAFPMERDWTGTGTEDGESLDESFENVSAPSSFLPPIALPPRPQKPPPPGKPALAVATKQPPPPPPPSAHPPKLPQRPVSQPRSSVGGFASQGSTPSPVASGMNSPVLARTPSASSSSVSLTSTRRVPPPPPIPSSAAAVTTPHPYPPPPRSRPHSARTSVQSTATTASDRSSIRSQGTTTSRTSTSSRASLPTTTQSTPVLPAAKQQGVAMRARYDTLFVANVRAHAPKLAKPPPSTPTPLKRQNAGWRGLSIDIATIVGAPPASAQAEPGPEPGPDARLDGRVVHAIWLKSRLESQRLRDIWCVLYSMPSHHLRDAEVIFIFLFCFVLVGMSAIRMERVRSTATRLRAGWHELTRSSGRLNCLVALVLAGTPRVVPGHCGRSLLVRYSAEFHNGHSYCDYAPRRCYSSTY